MLNGWRWLCAVAPIDDDSFVSRCEPGTLGTADAYIYPSLVLATCVARVHPDEVEHNHGAFRLTMHWR